jgi:hypothetical protein
MNTECGPTFTGALEGMFKDMETSQDLSHGFKEVFFIFLLFGCLVVWLFDCLSFTFSLFPFPFVVEILHLFTFSLLVLSIIPPVPSVILPIDGLRRPNSDILALADVQAIANRTAGRGKSEFSFSSPPIPFFSCFLL